MAVSATDTQTHLHLRTVDNTIFFHACTISTDCVFTHLLHITQDHIGKNREIECLNGVTFMLVENVAFAFLWDLISRQLCRRGGVYEKLVVLAQVSGRYSYGAGRLVLLLLNIDFDAS